VKDTIVLAYSGGLDTSVALRWLADEYDADVIALLIDVGQGIDAEAVAARAFAAGAGDVEVIDAREQFATDYVLPVLQAGALSAGIGALAAADRAAPGGGCPRPRREGGRPRLHGQGQRPGAVRDGGGRAGARPGGAGAGAGLGHDPRAGDRLRRAARHRGAGQVG
jgi:hypothetical protein